MKYTVFISYSWTNKLHRIALTECLKQIPEIELKIDESQIPIGVEIWNNISRMLDESDCIVVVLTKASAKSLSVYQELVRAHDRGIEIIPICHSQVANLPWFLRDIHALTFSDDESFLLALQKLKTQIEHRKASAGQRLRRRSIQSLSSAIAMVDEKRQTFRSAVLDQIIKSTTNEVTKLVGDYTLNIGIEANFLIRAKPLFRNASRVYAVSADNVSTFWSKQDLIDILSSYIKDQKTDTIRLFVFDSPASAHQYSEILEAHNRQYGQDGAVLLTTSQGYQRLLSTISGQPTGLSNVDFAVLDYGDYQLAATLDSSKLHFHEISEGARGAADRVDYVAYVRIMRSLASGTDVGEFNEDYRTKFLVLRWSPHFLSDRNLWAQKLKQLFNSRAGDHSGDIYHLVVLKRSVSAEVIAAVRSELRELRIGAELSFESLWSGRRLHLKVDDGVYHGSIETGSSDEMSTVLMFHFSSEADLRNYYSGRAHSAVRRRLYEELSDEIRKAYEEMDDLRARGRDVSGNYEAIESLAMRHIERLDFIYDEKIDDLVKSPPHPFLS